MIICLRNGWLCKVSLFGHKQSFPDVFMCLKSFLLQSGSLFDPTWPVRQGWKSGDHCMGDVRAYAPDPPREEESLVDPNLFDFKLVKCEVDNAKKGWEKYKFSLPQQVRNMYARDVVYGSDWRALLKEFDDRCQAGTGVFDYLNFSHVLCLYCMFWCVALRNFKPMSYLYLISKEINLRTDLNTGWVVRISSSYFIEA